jgi:hypothetical protein
MISDLEKRLADLGQQVAFPPTPPLAAMVRPLLSRPPRRPVFSRPRMILAAAAAAAVLLTVVLGVPPVRTAIAHWLGIQGVVISPVTSLAPMPTPHTTVSPSGPGSNLSLGQRSTLETARQTAAFPVVLPQALGSPDAVYERSDLGPVVTIVYGPRGGLPPSHLTGVGLLITEFRGATDPMLIQKFVGPETTVTPVTVDGGSGFWLDRAPHQLAYLLPGGGFAADTLRLAGPTLVFERGDVTIRLEGNLTETQALAIAHSLR